MGAWGHRTNEFQFGRQLIGGVQQSVGYSVIICKLFELDIEWYIIFSIASILITWYAGWIFKRLGLFSSFMKAQFEDLIKGDEDAKSKAR